MVNVKSIEEWVGNYYISTGLGMWESVKCWMDKEFDRKAAIDKALDHGRNAVKDVENRGTWTVLQRYRVCLRFTW